MKRAATRAAQSHFAMETLPSFGLLLFFRRRWRRRSGLRRRRGRLRRAGHAFLEAADAFAEALHHFGNAPAAKENQHNGQNNQPVKNTELTHGASTRPPTGSGRAFSTLAQSFARGKTVLLRAPIG